MKNKVLIMAGCYLPGVKGGGPIQSIKNLVDNLSDNIDFYIIAADRDLGDDKPFNNIDTDKWVKVGNANVFYTNNSLLTINKIKNLINSLKCDILYINSFFSYKYAIIPSILYKTRKISNLKVILAPRGQFSKGALGLKSFKKQIYVRFALLLNIYKEINWHATTILERDDIKKLFGKDINVFTANNLTSNYQNIQYSNNVEKHIGVLKLIYIARIHPMKNLLQTLDILKKVEGKVEFNIYGPIEDNEYWTKCQLIINQLSQNVKVNYHGHIPNEKVIEVYNKNHVSILLTLGENFGHSISEALIGGCPVIISDRTPWRNLDRFNAGYDIPLDKEHEIVEVINYFIKMNNNDFKMISRNAFEFAKDKSNAKQDIDSYQKMFEV